MHDLFVFGTLLDPELRGIVLGRAADGRGASLSGASIRKAQAGDWPVLAPEPTERAEGRLLEALSDSELARLHFYEKGFGYSPLHEKVDVAGGGERTALLYRPDRSDPPSREPWRLDAWQEDWGALTRCAAREVMALHGRIDVSELPARMPTIRMRADAARRAGAARRPAGTAAPWSRDDVQLLSARQPYAAYFAVDESDLSHPLFGGGTGAAVTRAAWISADAVTVLPYDPRGDRVHLVEQFRFGPYARGDRYPWILEPIAGRIDPGETPEQTARREAREEAGLELGRLLQVGTYYPSPGAMSEHVTSFVGICHLPHEGGWTGGSDAEHEDIRSHVIAFSELMKLLEQGELNSAPLLMSALWLARERARLRDVG